jgi:hypothetical protein
MGGDLLCKSLSASTNMGMWLHQWEVDSVPSLGEKAMDQQEGQGDQGLPLIMVQ